MLLGKNMKSSVKNSKRPEAKLGKEDDVISGNI